MRLALIHRAPGAAQPPADSTAWRTCLREIHFLSGPSFEEGALNDADAYALLLEVVCGLRSPLIGETEVQAQFKQFLESNDARGQRWIRSLGQRVLGDAKRIRHKHLQGFGAHSYGRLAAAHLAGRRIAVLGTGALAAQVILSAAPDALVDAWGRTDDRVLPSRPAGVTFSLIADAGNTPARTEPTTVVVAAPVTAEHLASVMAVYASVVNVVDLRAADQQTPIAVSVPVIVLADLLAGAAASDQAGAPRLRDARADIRNLAQAFAGREELRPFGWDDVCA